MYNIKKAIGVKLYVEHAVHMTYVYKSNMQFSMQSRQLVIDYVYSQF